MRIAGSLFRDAVEASGVPTLVVDADGRVERANPALLALSGHEADDVLGAAVWRLLPAWHPPSPLGPLQVAPPAPPATSASASQRPLRLRCGGGAELQVTVHTAEVSPEGPDGPRLRMLQVLDVSDQHRLRDQVDRLARHDPLTGLHNRRSFLTALDAHLARVDAMSTPVGAVLLVDLDRTSVINDLHGHAVGDEVIATVGRLLAGRVRRSDVVARLGADEFAVLLVDTTEDESRVVAASVAAMVRNHALHLPGGRIPLTCSVGLAVVGADGRSASEVLVAADLALHHAKEEGRDGWSEHARARREGSGVRQRMEWVSRIESALRAGCFELDAQPILQLRTGAVDHYELLLRMADGADGHRAMPAEFLPVAERMGVVPRIDRWVLGRTLDLLEATAGDPHAPTVAVNVSGPGLGDADLIGLVEERLLGGRVDPRRLVIEITETAAVTNLDAAREAAVRLRAAGASFALDDFGAGFGGLHYLKHLPVDVIKIDGEFVANCLTDEVDQAILRSIVGLARRLGKRTVAEHVGSDQAVSYLRGLGVDLAQGFHLGRPAPLATVPGLAAAFEPSGQGPG